MSAAQSFDQMASVHAEVLSALLLSFKFLPTAAELSDARVTAIAIAENVIRELTNAQACEPVTVETQRTNRYPA